jgi:hypothetical protein
LRIACSRSAPAFPPNSQGDASGLKNP